MIPCELVRRHIEAHVDEEVDPGTTFEIDRHLGGCPSCRDHRAFAASLKRAVAEAHRGAAAAPSGLRGRICAALDEVDRVKAEEPVTTVGNVSRMRLQPLRARYAVPAAAAAVALAVWAGRDAAPTGLAPSAVASSAVASRPSAAAEASLTTPAALGASDPQANALFEDVWRRHARQHPTEVQGPEHQVASWFRGKVAFPVRPLRFDRADVRLIGARLSSVRDRDAAAFYYDVRGRRVTVMVFEPPSPLDRVADRVDVGGRGVYLGRARGATVPMFEHDGLTYAITGDLDRESLLSLAASARIR